VAVGGADAPLAVPVGGAEWFRMLPEGVNPAFRARFAGTDGIVLKKLL
jgi:hypothetical protein